MFDLIESIAKADRPGTKLFTPADEFLRGMVDLMGEKEFAGRSGRSEAEIQRHLKRLKGRVVYTDPGHDSVMNYLPKGGEVKYLKRLNLTTGKETPGTDAPTDGPKEVHDGAIMQFQNVLTSKSQDRDGDILDPMGANIDPKSPLLWQHMPWEPCGKLAKTLAVNEDIVSTECAIADIPLGRDSATLVEFGALRISHGFVPVDYDQRKDANGNSLTGWDIKRYNVLEISLVSIPSNPDAVITAFSRNKLFHPLTKGWGESLHRKRAPIVNGATLPATEKTTDGAGNVTVNVTVNSGEQKPATKSKPKTKADDDDVQAGAGSDDDAATAPAGDDAAGKNGGNADDDTDGAKKPKGALAEMLAMVKTMGEGDALPQEAKDRMTTASNMLATVDTAVAECGDQFKAAADGRDIKEMLLVAYGTVDTVLSGIKGACEEVERASMVSGLDESQQASVDDLLDRMTGLWSEVAAAAGITDDPEADGDTNPEDDAAGDGDKDDDDDSPMPMASFDAVMKRLNELVLVDGIDDGQKAEVRDLAGAI